MHPPYEMDLINQCLFSYINKLLRVKLHRVELQRVRLLINLLCHLIFTYTVSIPVYFSGIAWCRVQLCWYLFRILEPGYLTEHDFRGHRDWQGVMNKEVSWSTRKNYLYQLIRSCRVKVPHVINDFGAACKTSTINIM